MVTKKGIIKKTEIKEFGNIRSNGLIAITLENNDELTWVKPTTGDNELILVTAEGKSIRFHESEVRPMGRNAKGVIAMKLKTKSDFIVSMDVIKDEKYRLLTVSENGYAKMTELAEYGAQKRAGSGIYTFNVTKKTGNVASARILDNPEETQIVIISEKSKVIRSNLDNIPTQGRQTSGVKIMNLDKGDKITTVALI
jgi:DNA gyrase subunit A